MTKLRERYDNLDGLRAISCLLIIVYHVKKYGEYRLSGVPADIIDLFTQFVPLFLIISGFGIFCGYYERMKNREISLSAFYKRRYAKILPFFAFVLLIYCVLEHSVSGTIEALTQATLTYGLLPSLTMGLCSVAWTIGIIFLFYMLFPFIVFLCDSKRSALISFGISIVLSIFCYSYFFKQYGDGAFMSRHNFLYLAPYFMGGAVTYLFRDSIKRVISAHRIIALIVCLGITVGYYFIPDNIADVSIIVLKNLLLFLPWLWYSISVKSYVLSNPVASFLSKISLELYLSQMLIFHLVEKFPGLHFAGNGWLGYIAASLLIIIGDVIFVEAFMLIKKWVVNLYQKSRAKKGATI